jgi:prolyl-tRNA synthetase
MATFGIGVSRLISAIIEQNHDEKGCIWTKSTAPFFVDIIVSNGKNENEQKIANNIAKEFDKLGIENIIDDRKKERFGFKMGDFELIGFPYAIVVGKKIKDSLVEVINRKTLQRFDIDIDKVALKIKEFKG